MSAVTGPTTYLPGEKISPPLNQMCDNHPNQPAISRIVGEVDSYGSEMSDFCQECLTLYEQSCKRVGCCDWCGCESSHLRPRRDYDEGNSGPIYYVCDPCIDKQVHQAVDEMEQREDDLEEPYDFSDDICEEDEDADDEDYRCKDLDDGPIRPLNFNTKRW